MPAAANASRLGEPQDRAVEVVVELVALRLDLADHRLGGLRVVAVAHVGGVEAERLQPLLEVLRGALGRIQVEREEVQAALRDHGGVLGPHRARGGVARVDQRLVGMRLVVVRERRAQHHGLAADLHAPAGVHAIGHPVGQGANEHGDVVAGRPVAARDGPREPPVLVDERQRQPVELGHHDHRLAGEAGEEGLHLLGLGRLLEREHRPRVPDRRVQHRRRADLLQRVRVGSELRVRADQRAQLVLDRVVLRVRHRRRTPVVRVAQGDDLIGEFLDPLAGAHPPHLMQCGDGRLRASCPSCGSRRPSPARTMRRSASRSGSP